MYIKMFASDNNSGIHPDILQSIVEVNEGHSFSYGEDHYTRQSIDKMKEFFGENIHAFYVFNGTGANVLALSSITKSYHAVICTSMAHIHNDEAGAFEAFTGAKLLTCPSTDGKITIKQIKKHVEFASSTHRSKPIAVSISQCTEMGTVYTRDEVRELADFVHENGMYLHMDGARLSNAAASLNASLKEVTADCGVDVLSFGGTKNGLMVGETVIFFNEKLAKDFGYIRKQGMQLGSKMRFIAAQFHRYLTDDLWLKNAQHANSMAQKLATQLCVIPGFELTQQVETNAIFAKIPNNVIQKLKEKLVFSIWNEQTSEIRLVTSFDTTEEDVQNFMDVVKQNMSM
jgi:threonine aldolase